MNRRSITALALLVSFVAMATSGLLMLIVDRPSFTIRMHPVHKTFGIVMIVAGLSHLGLNLRTAWSYLKQRAARLATVLLVALLVLAYAAVALRTLPDAAARRLDAIAAELEE